MLNLNKVGRPLARIDGGKYSGRVVSVSDQFASNAKEGDDGLIKEFRQLKIANDSKFQHIPDTTKERSIFLHHRTVGLWQIYLHSEVFRTV